eukprot:GHVL01026900.1.p1 GENE.GHVL01026900.1~~GHVL01026900.1.p1  ORF type:complete len:675 (-),score=100.12 GHVL01026900.1:69-2093(-)
MIFDTIIRMGYEICETVNESPRSAENLTVSTALSLVRLLTRMMPFLLETPGDEFIKELFWDEGDNKDTPCLAVSLISMHFRFLFLKGFTVLAPGVTIAKNTKLPTNRIDSRLLWKGGVGSSSKQPTNASSHILKNRAEVLRCLLMCLSEPLFQSVEQYHAEQPQWLTVACSGTLPYTANLFCSLISCVLQFDTSSSILPLMGSSDDLDFINYCAQILCILTDYNPEIFPSPNSDDPVTKTDTPSDPGSPVADGLTTPRYTSSKKIKFSEPKNVFREMLAGLHKQTEMDLMFKGFTRLLNSLPESRATYLPSGVKPATFYHETVLVVWQLVTCNPEFVQRVTADSNHLILPLIFILLDSNNGAVDLFIGGPSRTGLLHVCGFILLVLSSSRSFAVRLNEPFTSRIPVDVPSFSGNYADLYVIALHRVVSNSGDNDSLIDMLLTVLVNVSAYVKAFCLESSTRLLVLFQRFSHPSWLFKAPYRYYNVLHLLETFNNVIQYQYEGNQRLIYSILRNAPVFKALENLSLTDWLEKRKTVPVELQKSNSFEANKDGSPQFDDQGVFEPTIEWFDEWKKRLPLDPCKRLIECLLPQVEAVCCEKELLDAGEVLQFLQKTTMVGLLPVPHPIIIRNYQTSVYTALWFSSYLWGVIFSRNQTLAFFDWRKIKMVVIDNLKTN